MSLSLGAAGADGWQHIENPGDRSQRDDVPTLQCNHDGHTTRDYIQSPLARGIHGVTDEGYVLFPLIRVKT